jgi:hypothetical protein
MVKHHKRVRRNRRKRKTGSGLLNWVINHLPTELHLPGYRFCGPGTRLQKRLAEGQQGINQLDELCKQHDIAYDRFQTVVDRNEADYKLQLGAQKIASDPNTRLTERLAAKLVARVMKTKRQYGV